MNVLKLERKALIVQLVCEGMTLRGVSRATGHHLTTVMRVVNEAGENCARLHDEYMRDLTVDCVQCDETWAYLTTKEGRRLPKHGRDAGDQYLFVGLEQSSKAVVVYALGRRNHSTTDTFVRDLASRVAGRFHLATDGWRHYRPCVAMHLAGRVDYGQVVKSFGGSDDPDAIRRYAPPTVTAIKWLSVSGYPNRKYVCTSHVERFNATLRTSCRRFARLSLAVNRRLENLENGVRVAIAAYNFIKRSRGAGGLTPAMALGVASEPWGYDQLIPTKL